MFWYRAGLFFTHINLSSIAQDFQVGSRVGPSPCVKSTQPSSGWYWADSAAWSCWQWGSCSCPAFEACGQKIWACVYAICCLEMQEFLCLLLKPGGQTRLHFTICTITKSSILLSRALKKFNFSSSFNTFKKEILRVQSGWGSLLTFKYIFNMKLHRQGCWNGCLFGGVCPYSSHKHRAGGDFALQPSTMAISRCLTSTLIISLSSLHALLANISEQRWAVRNIV